MPTSREQSTPALNHYFWSSNRDSSIHSSTSCAWPFRRSGVDPPKETVNPFILGLSLGLVNNVSGLAVLEKLQQGTDKHYHCRGLRRWPSKAFPVVVDEVAKLVDQPPLLNCMLVVDATGGRPVLDLIRHARLKVSRLLPVTIVTGENETNVNGQFHVGLAGLLTGVRILLQSNRLRFADKLPDLPALFESCARSRWPRPSMW